MLLSVILLVLVSSRYFEKMSLEEEVYQKIIKYYEISDKMKEEILNLKDIDDETKNNVLMPIPETIKSTADNLLDLYIQFLKNIKNIKNVDLKREIIEILNNLLEQIYKYKNIIYNLYKDTV